MACVRETMNDAEINEPVTGIRRRERALQQAKNALGTARREAAAAVCPSKKGELIVG